MVLDAASLDALIGAPPSTRRERAIELGRKSAGDQASAIAALGPWLDAREPDVRALDLVFEVLLGIRRETQLAWNHRFFWGLCTSGDRASDPSLAIEVVGNVLEDPASSPYAARHARRWFRAAYERGVALTPDARATLDRLGVAWELVPLRSLAEAWEVAIALTCTEETQIAPAGGCPHVWEVVDGGQALAGDVLIAGFITAHPRVLEHEILRRRAELAERDGSVGLRALSNVFERGIDGMRWRRVHAVYDPALGLQLFELAHREHLFDLTTTHNSFHIACDWYRRAPDSGATLAPEMRDVLRALVDKTPLPAILPDDLSNHSPDRIEAELADYAGITVDELHARLRPGALSAAGFLREGDRIGEVIARDAATLRALGVDRHALADRLAGVLRDGPRGELEVTGQSYLGHQQDPFHTYDVYGLNGHHGATDFTIRRGELSVGGGDLQIPMIHRACFFGGPGCYRLDPDALIRLLDLA